MVDYQRRGTDLPLAGEKMGGSSKDNDVAAKYAEELVSLRMNSKPLINSLTMMAEDYMKQAPIVVQTIESHLARAPPNCKLPVLYLIDSIIKNVKRDYITLFAENIVTSFCRVFERVRADEKTRLQMWKVRQTWTEIFPTNKLYQIDVKARSMDPGWPLAKLPSTSIHVNPKFLHIKSKTKSTSDSPSTSPKSTDERTSPSTVGGEDDEVRMREELLIKQKKLIELQQKKLELELMQTQARIAEAERLKASKGKDSEDKEKLLKQAEIAKQRTNMATSIMAKASTKKQKESRRSVSPAASDKTSKSSSSTTSTTTSSKTTATIIEANEITDPRLSKTRVAHIKSEKVSPKKDEKKSPKKHSSPSGSSTSSKNELKIEKVKDEPQTSKSELNDNKDKDRKRSKSKSDDSSRSQSREKSQYGQHHDSPDRVSNRDSSREKNRTKSDSSSSPEKSDRSGKRGGSSSGREREHSHSSSSSERGRSKDRIETDSSSVKSSSPRKSNVEDKESLNNRRSAVLSKSYRKRQEPGEKDRKIKTEPSTSGDTDLRFSSLQDVDLRREGTDGVNEPSPKKSRLSAKSAIIEEYLTYHFLMLIIYTAQKYCSNFSVLYSLLSTPAHAIP
jgi:pre-mRNA cleavage complex 2 protein Pcf11